MLTRILLTVSLLLFTGCHAVYSSAPVGDEPVALDPADWNGTWLTADGAARILVTNAQTGKLDLAWHDEGANGELVSRVFHIQIRQWEADDADDAVEGRNAEQGPWQFASISDENNPSRFSWGRVKKDERQILFWAPDLERFKEAVRDGSLPGDLTDDNVYLGELADEHMLLITSQDQGLYFDWDNPAALIRHGQ